MVWQLEGKKVSITWRTYLPKESSGAKAHKTHKDFCVAYEHYCPCRNVSLVQVLPWRDFIISSRSSTIALCCFPWQTSVQGQSILVQSLAISPQSPDNRNNFLFSHPPLGKSCGRLFSFPSSLIIQDICSSI